MTLNDFVKRKLKCSYDDAQDFIIEFMRLSQIEYGRKIMESHECDVDIDDIPDDILFQIASEVEDFSMCDLSEIEDKVIEKYMNKIKIANIISSAESLDWAVTDLCFGDDIAQFEFRLEFQKYSPAGEDFSFTAESDSPEGIVEEIETCYADFDAEEHVEMWIGGRGAPSIKILVDDADAIQDMLQELAEEVT